MAVTESMQVTSDAGRATLELIGQARQSLAEARTLPDIRLVMEAASVAKEAAERAARLLNAERRAAEVVAAATAAANDAAAVRIEAQAKAGELLRTLAEHSGRASAGGDGRNQHRGSSQYATTLDDLGVSKSESSRWQQVAAVPPEIRAEYVDERKSARGEVSTAGLLRYSTRASAVSTASGRGQPAVDHAAIAEQARKQARSIYRDLVTLAGYRQESLVAALDNSERKHLLRALDQLCAWIDGLKAELAVYHVTKEG